MVGSILVLSGPSGAGKSTIISEASEDIGDYYFSISTTTRSPREGEVDGKDYHFVDRVAFEDGIKAGDFLEYAEVHNNYYGTSLKPVREALDARRLVIFDIDIQGHRLIRAKLGDITTSVFITPPTLSELRKRLQKRSTDTQEVIDKRLIMAKREIQRVSEYDFIVINDDLKLAADVLKQIAKTARLKIPTDRVNNFVNSWEDI